MDLPIRYSLASWEDREAAIGEYTKLQKGLCYYCHGPLTEQPIKDEAVAFLIQKAFDSEVFPRNFLLIPIHLHHGHKTDLTIGVIHSYCNAALWVIEGE